MKHGKNPTVRQKKLLKANGLNPDNWLVTSDTHQRMEIVHRSTNTTKTISKEGSEKND